jgi:hypothetical protein
MKQRMIQIISAGRPEGVTRTWDKLSLAEQREGVVGA